MDILQLIENNLGSDVTKRLVPGKILAVDDDEGNLVVLEDLLIDDYEVVTTTSPHEAMKLVDSTEFDMVISDQRMPGITGVELLSRVRETHPDTVRMIISAYSDAKAILQAINEGQVYRFILKPWDPEEVDTVVKQGLEHRLHVLAIKTLVTELAGKNVRLEEALEQLHLTQEKLLHSAKLATVGQLTASIVHELKNHITGVRLLTEIVDEAQVPEELADYARMGHDSAKALFDMINGINSFARKDAWKLKRGRTTVQELLDDTLSIVKTDARTRMRELTLGASEGVPALVLDSDKMRQVLVNLVRNALDATDQDGRVELSAFALNESTVAFKVADNGSGITPEQLESICDPFFTTKDNGLGLGLEICRQIVEAHGGQLKIDSTVGQGTDVVVALPVRPEFVD